MEKYMDLSAQCNVSSVSFYIVMPGVPTCPHCQAMEAFFKTLPVDSYYCNIQQEATCNQAFWKLYDKGVTTGTPTILV
jgi:glutaredoxin